MYKQSNDLRFEKSKKLLQRAFIDLTLEKRSPHITVKELTGRAGVNRMTFYSHYDEVPDILLEFIDDLTATIVRSQHQDGLDIERMLLKTTEMMEDEMEFYRLVANDGRFELYRTRFREAFFAILSNELGQSTNLKGIELDIAAAMLASGITYAYLDWLAGKYGVLPIEELIAFCNKFIMNQIASATNYANYAEQTRAQLVK